MSVISEMIIWFLYSTWERYFTAHVLDKVPGIYLTEWILSVLVSFAYHTPTASTTQPYPPQHQSTPPQPPLHSVLPSTAPVYTLTASITHSPALHSTGPHPHSLQYIQSYPPQHQSTLPQPKLHTATALPPSRSRKLPRKITASSRLTVQKKPFFFSFLRQTIFSSPPVTKLV